MEERDCPFFFEKPKYRWSPTEKMNYRWSSTKNKYVLHGRKNIALPFGFATFAKWNEIKNDVKSRHSYFWQIWKRETWASKPSLESGTCSNILHITFLIVIINCYFLSFLFFSQYRCIIISFSFLFFVFLFFSHNIWLSSSLLMSTVSKLKG